MDSLIFSTLEKMPTVGVVVIIFISLYVLGKAADFLVDEAITLSAMWRIPKAIVGATIVSLGTTIPEVTVSAMAAMNGNSDLALGNAIGSIITNTTLILGLAALIGKVPVDKGLMKKQGGMLIFSTLLLSVVSLPIFSASNQGLVSRKMGLMFLVLLVIYLYISINSTKNQMDDMEEVLEKRSNLVQLLRLFGGVLLVILSSKVLIPSVEITATRIGIPESVIAATLVAFGTSVPELMTSLTAVKKGHGELAVGNVIGANILNILFVVGGAAVISKEGLLFPSLYFKLQVPMMLLTSVVLYVIGMNKEGRLRKKDGAILLGAYILYIVLNYLS